MTSTESAIAPTKKKISLYDINESFLALDDLLEDMVGDDERDGEVIAAWWQELDGQLSDKLTKCVAWAREQEALAAAAKSEAKRLQDVARVRDNKVDRLRRLVREVFEMQNLARVDTPLGAVRLVANGGKAPILIGEIEIATLPDDCKRVVVEPIKEAIRARIEAGEVIEGCAIGERGKSLRLG